MSKLFSGTKNYRLLETVWAWNILLTSFRHLKAHILIGGKKKYLRKMEKLHPDWFLNKSAYFSY